MHYYPGMVSKQTGTPTWFRRLDLLEPEVGLYFLGHLLSEESVVFGKMYINTKVPIYRLRNFVIGEEYLGHSRILHTVGPVIIEFR